MFMFKIDMWILKNWLAGKCGKKQKKTEDVGKIQENAEKCGKQEMAENGRIWQGKGGEIRGKFGKMWKKEKYGKEKAGMWEKQKKDGKRQDKFSVLGCLPCRLDFSLKKNSLADFFKIFMQEIIFVFKNFKCHIFIRYEAPAESMINNLCKCFPMGDSSVLQMHILIYICFSVIKIIFTFAEIQFHPLPSFWSLNSKYWSLNSSHCISHLQSSNSKTFWFLKTFELIFCVCLSSLKLLCFRLWWDTMLYVQKPLLYIVIW